MIKARYHLLLASRSSVNESTGKDVYGAIVRENPTTEEVTDIVTCYCPNKRQAEIVLAALNQ